jgi:hypothetical protein
MKRIICAAVVALGLMLASGGEAKANGFTFNPGYINLTGGIGVSWGGGGWTCFPNNCGPQQGGYGYFQPPVATFGQPMATQMPAYNPYGMGGYGMGYGYGWGY